MTQIDTDGAPSDDLTPDEIAQLVAELEQKRAKIFCITHHYDVGDQNVYVRRITGDIDAKRAAIYCQFKAEEWLGEKKLLTNLGVAALLVTFYGYQHTSITDICTVIDMYIERELAMLFEDMALVDDRHGRIF